MTLHLFLVHSAIGNTELPYCMFTGVSDTQSYLVVVKHISAMGLGDTEVSHVLQTEALQEIPSFDYV